MKFVQIIEYKTSHIDEIRNLGEKFRANSADQKVLPINVTITKDRDAPNTFRTIALFESYEAAMANSKRPETGEFAAKMAELCDGPAKFYNLDVLDEM